ncbi:MAG: hypothetical protein ABI183_02575 [Polyangiaceae bacterium]
MMTPKIKAASWMVGAMLGCAVGFSPTLAHAQVTSAPTADEPDVVMLKHGGQIRGHLVEMLAGDHATISMTGGQNAIIRWDEIGSISRGGVAVKLPDAPPPVAPAPMVAQPQPAQRVIGPERVDYDADEPIPTGYHVESHYRLGLLITGAILTGIGLLGIVAYDAQGDVTGDDRVAFDVVFGALFMGPGLPLLIVGLASPRKQLVRDDVSLLQPIYDAVGIHGKAPPVFLGVTPPFRHSAQAERRAGVQSEAERRAGVQTGMSLGFRF